MTPLLNIQAKPTPTPWSGSLVIAPPAGTFTADMDTLTADDTTHTADEN